MDWGYNYIDEFLESIQERIYCQSDGPRLSNEVNNHQAWCRPRGHYEETQYLGSLFGGWGSGG